jgi:enoyl-CoA hydratase/carnithine racemase
MTAALFALDADDGIGCIVVTGNERSHSPRKSHRFPCRS